MQASGGEGGSGGRTGPRGAVRVGASEESPTPTSTPTPSPGSTTADPTVAPTPNTPHDQLARSGLMETKHSGQEELAEGGGWWWEPDFGIKA